MFGFLVSLAKVVGGFLARSSAAQLAVGVIAAKQVSKLTAKETSNVVANRSEVKSPSGGDGSGREQIAPAADNKLPVVYGSAWITGTTTDAKISSDEKYIWYVVPLCEVTDTGTITFDTTDGVYYESKKVTFGTNGAVATLTTNTTPAQVDDRMAGKIYIWLFSNGSSSGFNTGGQTAIQIMSDAVTGGGIVDGWNTSLYTTGGQSPTMDNTCFAIVRLEYNPDAGTTGLGTLQIKVINNMGATNGAKPGTAILDYLQNIRYGCGIPSKFIDTTSLTALNTYSDQSISYTPVGGGSATQPYRYRFNGAIDTSRSCLQNLQFMVDCCDSWLQYSELTGKWKVVINKPYSGSLASLFHVNAGNDESCNVIGGITITPLDLNNTYNEVEVTYPNTNTRDQSDYQILDLTDPTTAWYANYNTVLSPNEPINRLNISLPLVNEAVQAKYIAARRLLQSREDLTISFATDYSGIQVEAGDVIRVTHPVYGWTDKLFRVQSVDEQQYEDGSLGARIDAFEYSDDVYNDNAIQDFVPSNNTGLRDPNVISQPGQPSIVLNDTEFGQVKSFNVTSAVPESGTILYMDFNYGTTSNTAQHVLYRTLQAAGGVPFTNSTDIANNVVNNLSIDVNDLTTGTYYFSTTARNDFAGRTSNSSASFSWSGANLVTPVSEMIGNVSSNGNIVTYSGNGNIFVGSTVNVIGSNGYFANGTIVVNVISNTQFEVSPTPLTPLFSDNVMVQTGGLLGTQIQSNTIQGSSLAGNTVDFRVMNSDTGALQEILSLTANANPNTLPVDLTTLTIANSSNVPWYLDGTNVDPNYYYPYYQNTSTTANGYLANSTAPFQPDDARNLVLAQGDDDWYSILGGTYSSPVIVNENFEERQYLIQFVSNANTSIQLFPVTYVTISNVIFATGSTQFMTTIDLVANQPYFWNGKDSGVWTANVDDGGLMVRNMVANTRVYGVSLQGFVSKGKL